MRNKTRNCLIGFFIGFYVVVLLNSFFYPDGNYITWIWDFLMDNFIFHIIGSTIFLIWLYKKENKENEK